MNSDAERERGLHKVSGKTTLITESHNQALVLPVRMYRTASAKRLWSCGAPAWVYRAAFAGGPKSSAAAFLFHPPTSGIPL